jgi:hypothetical protein
MMEKWYNGLPEKDKLRVVEVFCNLVRSRGAIVIGGERTVYPSFELPHGPENAKAKRVRERKEKKISDKCRAVAVGRMYVLYLDGTFHHERAVEIASVDGDVAFLRARASVGTGIDGQ